MKLLLKSEHINMKKFETNEKHGKSVSVLLKVVTYKHAKLEYKETKYLYHGLEGSFGSLTLNGPKGYFLR